RYAARGQPVGLGGDGTGHVEVAGSSRTTPRAPASTAAVSTTAGIPGHVLIKATSSTNRPPFAGAGGGRSSISCGHELYGSSAVAWALMTHRAAWTRPANASPTYPSPAPPAAAASRNAWAKLPGP